VYWFHFWMLNDDAMNYAWAFEQPRPARAAAE
jgi:hypothetical protein